MSIVSSNTQWYRCDSRIGELAVGIDTGVARLQEIQGPELVLQQAMLLSEVELTLQAFELWQDTELDLVPMSGPSGNGSTALPDNEVELVITHSSLPGYLPTRFRFSKQALPQLLAVDDQLTQSLELAWSSLPVVVTLDQLELDENESGKISSGATVLIPASFTAPWQARISVPGIDGLSFSALLDAGQKRLTLCPADEKPARDSSRYQTSIRLANLLPVSPAQLLGDTSGKILELSDGSAALTALVEINGAAMAVGAIGEVGQGYAVHVSRMLVEDQATWS